MNVLFKFLNYIIFVIIITICQIKVLFHGQIQREFDDPVCYNIYTFADKLLYPMHMLSKWLISLLHNWNLFLGFPSPRFLCRPTALYIFARAVGRQRTMHTQNIKLATRIFFRI